jgi:hypothetical protein
VTLPSSLVAEIDRFEKNRSRFVQEGIRREIRRRQRQALRESLQAPHAETGLLADEGFEEWARSLPDEAADDLVSPAAGTAVRWTPGSGWRKARE